jgi:hypothetical protein
MISTIGTTVAGVENEEVGIPVFPAAFRNPALVQ